jgi:uncharacterized protein
MAEVGNRAGLGNRLWHGACVEPSIYIGLPQRTGATPRVARGKWVLSSGQGMASATSSQRTNRLIDSTSPYLLQHAHNPVDWYPWGDEAIEKAKRENKPIFLSIGYSACHWCHVMEREVFESEPIAALMNEHFVNIKVDREERPDLDEIYMLATQLLTGSGGWPMSVWLLPTLEPFYAGTYFPPVDGHGRPGFPRLILALADAWKNRPDELRQQAAKVVDAVRHRADESERQGAGGEIDLDAAIGGAVEQWADSFDSDYGGVGSSPKFPPHQALGLWLSLLKFPGRLKSDLAAALREMATKTLDGMMRGGIYDQVGGGFARYSTDAQWLVPHFEKMLYDNAQLAPVYAAAAVQFGRADYARIARQTLDFYLREMAPSDGGSGAFYSALDADSEGIEGKYYTWTLGHLHEALGSADDVKLIATHFGITESGNWEEGNHAWNAGANVLFVERPIEDLAKEINTAPESLTRRIDTLLSKLRNYRAKRVPPFLDDKILTSWNGLMVSALAVCGRLLREPRYLEAAHRLIGFLLLNHMAGGRHLLRVSRKGKAHTPAFLEDHAYLLNGLMDLIDATVPTSLPGTMARKRALELADVMVRDFSDDTRAGFRFTPVGRDSLFAHIKNAADGATPSANGVAIRALLRLADVSGKEEYRERALRAVASFSALVERGPSLVPTILRALHENRAFRASNPYLNVRAAEVDEVHVERGIALTAEQAASETVEMVASVEPSFRLQPVDLPPVKPGQTFDLPLVVHIARGFHIQAARPQDAEAFATVARIRGDLPIATQEWIYPAPETIAASGSTLHGYHGVITITGRLTVAHNAAGGSYSLRAVLQAQPCSGESCLPPEKATLTLVVRVIP